MSDTESSATARRTMTIRLTLPQWRRVKELALEVDSSVQDLTIAGFNRLFAERGYDPLDPESPIEPPTRRRRKA